MDSHRDPGRLSPARAQDPTLPQLLQGRTSPAGQGTVVFPYCLHEQFSSGSAAALSV